MATDRAAEISDAALVTEKADCHDLPGCSSPRASFLFELRDGRFVITPYLSSVR